MPTTGVRPPFLMFAAVLAIAPVAGMPPNNAEPMLPIPCATSSMLELCFEPIIPSATTQESRDSIAASTAMVSASGKSAPTAEKLNSGSVKAGRLLLMEYRSPMVFTGRLQSFTSSTLATIAMREPGIRRLIRGPKIRISRQSAPTRSAYGLKVEKFAASAFAFSMVSTATVPAA